MKMQTQLAKTYKIVNSWPIRNTAFDGNTTEKLSHTRGVDVTYSIQYSDTALVG